MSSQRTVWTGYKPHYQNALEHSQSYNPVELMGYVGSPTYVVRGIGAKIDDSNLTNLALWSAKIGKDGSLGEDRGPEYFGTGTSLDQQVILPENWVAVAWGMLADESSAENIVIWARTWNPETQMLEGEAKFFSNTGNDKVQMSTPISEDTQQIIMGVGAGVNVGEVNRIAAGYATLGLSPESPTVPIIWGSVDENGKIISGRNFISSIPEEGSGIYHLSWRNNPPGVIPIVGLTSGTRDGEDGSDNIFSFDEVTDQGCTIYSVDVGSKNKEPEDEAFSFVAFFPGQDIPGLVFGSVDEEGNKLRGSEGWSPVYRTKGRYQILLDPEMIPPPNLIMTSGMRSGESTGSDCIISNTFPKPGETYVFSLDVDGGETKNEDQAFSFFAWNVNVLPTNPAFPQASRAMTSLRIGEDGVLESVDSRAFETADRDSAFYVVKKKGKGNWEVLYNFPLPETPIIYTAPVKKPSGEDDGAKRILSFSNVSTTSYELWSIEVGNGKHKASPGAQEATVVLPDQFPI